MILLFGAELAVCYLYLIVLSWVTNQWDEIEEIRIPKDYAPHYSYSIIIPYRNESKNIAPCIQSLLNMEAGPRFEVITVNDHSTDNSEQIIDNFQNPNIKSLKAHQFGKKTALELGINHSSNEFIITLDADCFVHKDWLKLVDQSIHEENLDVLVGPVKFAEESSFLSRFQFMDLAATIATTAAGIQSKSFYVCSGANFVYKKNHFEHVNGFEGNRHIASGDDVFLLQKFVKSHLKTGFLKSNRGSVTTKPESSWLSLFRQRKRWATKTKAYANKKILQLQSFIFGMCLLSWINFMVLPFFIADAAVIIGLFFLFIKGVIDFLFLNKIIRFFGSKKVLKAFIPSFIFFHFYYIIIGMQAIIPTKVDWKGRSV